MSEQTTTDAIESLAISMRSQPSVFALLLGSGVSRSAGVLTGWEVMNDLIRQIAKMRGEDCGSDLVQWYRDCFGNKPNYSQIVKNLGLTASDRKSILKEYFEPTYEDLEQGLKQPNEAHLAIAELVAHGYVKVIITTNFDRLIENAISQAGVEPVVLSTDGDFANAEPLAHMRCCVIKLHGDYLDPDTLNTEEELSNYDDDKRFFLERALEDYGLVVCGWSADWDHKLRESLQSTDNQHYATYWHVFGNTSEQSENCIITRSARKIQQGDADHLFSRVRDHVLALEEYAMRPPDNDELATATYKRLLSENRYRIRLQDFTKDLVAEVSEAATRIAPPSLIHSAPRKDTVEPKLEELESVASKLVNCAFVAGQWLEAEHVDLWHRAFQKLVYCETSPQHVSEWHSLREFPAVMVLHALGAGAVLARRYESFGRLLHSKVDQVPLEDDRIAHIPEWVHKVLDHHFTPIFALHERIFETIRVVLLDANYMTNQFSPLYSEAEILQVLAQAPFDPEYSTAMPLGRFMSISHDRECEDIFEKIRGSIKTLESNSPYVSSAIFGDTPELCLAHLNDLTKQLPKIRQQVRFQRYN